MRDVSLAADGIVLKDGEVVLVYRKNYPEGWALPGGFLEEGETLAETCVREVKEEAGLKVEVVDQVGATPEFGIYDSPDRDPRGRTVTAVFVCKAVGGELKAETDAKEVDLFELEEALELDLQFDHRRILKDFYEFRS